MNTNVQSDFQKSLNFIKKKEYKNALEILLNLKNKNSRDPNVLFYLGLIYAETNNIEKSIFFYEQLLKDQPNSLNALYNLAGVKSAFNLKTCINIFLLSLVNSLKSLDYQVLGLLVHKNF